MLNFKKLSEKEKDTIITLGVLSWFSVYVTGNLGAVHIAGMKELKESFKCYIEQAKAMSMVEFMRIKKTKTQKKLLEEAKRLIDRLPPEYYSYFHNQKKAIEAKGKEVFKVSKKQLEDLENANTIKINVFQNKAAFEKNEQ